MLRYPRHHPVRPRAAHLSNHKLTREGLCRMIHSLECKRFSRSLLQLDLSDNKVLLWCAVVLKLSTFPVVYMPTITNQVFLLSSLNWEWGIVVCPSFLDILSNAS